MTGMMIPYRHRSASVLAWLLAAMLLSLAGLLLEAAPLRVGSGQSADFKRLVIERARLDIGLTEATGRNDGPKISKALRRVGAPPRSPWCMAIVFTWWDDACRSLGRANTLLRTGSTQAAFTHALTTYGLLSDQQPQAGDVIIWRIPRTWLGHAGLVTSVRGTALRTIEGNTSNTETGSQRDGQGVWSRRRFLTRAMTRLVVRGFIG